MGQVAVRKLIRMGDGGLVVSIPPGWLRFHGLKPGDKVEIVTNGKITIRPATKRVADKEAPCLTKS